MRVRGRFPATLAFCTLAAAACGDAESPNGGGAWGGTVADSAGVRVVINPELGLWADDPPWTLEEELRIGGPGAADTATFGAVSAIDVDGRGRIHVADPQASELRIFDADGHPLGTLAGPGSGPGELGGEIPVVVVDDVGVRIVDTGNMRVTRFHSNGELATATGIDVSQGIPLRWDRRPDGELVVQLRSAGEGIGADLEGRDEVRLLGDTTALFALPRGGGLVMEEGPGPPRFRPFAPEPLWDLGESGRFVSGMNDMWRLEVRDASGALLHVIARPHTPRRLTESDRAVLRDAFAGFLEHQGIPPAAIRQFVDGVEFGEVYPAFVRLLMAPDNTVWVQRMRLADELAESGAFDPGDLGDDSWDVFDPDGRYLGALRLPPRFRPLRFVGDALYGVQADALGVPAVVRLRLVRG